MILDKHTLLYTTSSLSGTCFKSALSNVPILMYVINETIILKHRGFQFTHLNIIKSITLLFSFLRYVLELSILIYI